MAAEDPASAYQEALDGGLLGPADFAVVPGPRPVLFSAPHAYPHPRQERLKAADTGTGALVLAAAAMSGGWAMTMLRTAGYDPNWDSDDPYKAHVARLVRSGAVRAVVDLHGMRNEALDAELGTGGGATLPGDLTAAIVALLAPLRVAVDVRFAARHAGTVTQHAWAAGARAVQIEMGPRLRRDPAARVDLLARLAAVADLMSAP